MQINRLDKFKLPLGGQEIELQDIDYGPGGMRQLRIRIRERSRFTTVDVDPASAAHWGQALTEWARRQVADEAGRAAAPAGDDARAAAEGAADA